jgi:hypothetical protein
MLTVSADVAVACVDSSSLAESNDVDEAVPLMETGRSDSGRSTPVVDGTQRIYDGMVWLMGSECGK